MTHGTNPKSVRTSVRPAASDEAVDRLVTSWLCWERNPSSRPAVVEKEDAIKALGLASNETHEYIAAARRAGFDVPSAVVRTVNDLGSRCAD